MQITISIPDEVFNTLDLHRKSKYPHLKKVSRMILQMTMDRVREEQLDDKRIS